MARFLKDLPHTNFLKYLPSHNYGQQWRVMFGLGFFVWFAIVCFGKVLPAGLLLLTSLVPICCFSYCLWILPKWQKEGRKNDLTDSLIEREASHAMRNRHLLNLAAMDFQHAEEMEALREVFPTQPSSGEDLSIAVDSHSEASETSNHLMKMQQEVFQTCSDIGWALVEYLSGKGYQFCEKDGWISIEKIRSNWGKSYHLNTEQLRQLLIALTSIQAGEWRDSSLKRMATSPNNLAILDRTIGPDYRTPIVRFGVRWLVRY